MEFPELGKRCTHVSCLQLDCLPVKCDLCSKVFCQDHSSSSKHDCQKNDSNPVAKKEATKNKLLKCTYEECTVMSPVEMLCVTCQQHFCFDHRLHYFCYDNRNMYKSDGFRENNKTQFLKAKAASDRQVDNKLKELIKNSKFSATALKVRLMKVKRKAYGDARIPTEDRVYFMVHPSLLTPGLVRAVFISKDWPIAKCIDVFSKKMLTENNNEKPDNTKLRLFNKEDGTVLDNNTNFGNLIKEKAICDGGSLVLEYVTEKTVQLVNNNPTLTGLEHYT